MLDVNFKKPKIYNDIDLSEFSVGDLYFITDKETQEKYIGICAAIQKTLEHILFINIMEIFPPNEQTRNIIENKAYDYEKNELEELEIKWIPYNFQVDMRNCTFTFGDKHYF